MKRLAVLLMLFFYANSSYAFVAMIWDCKVAVPDSYMVDTRYEANHQSVNFQKHNTVLNDHPVVLRLVLTHGGSAEALETGMGSPHIGMPRY